MFWKKLIYIFKDAGLRGRIFFIIFILAIYRLLANIPIPTIDSFALDALTNSSATRTFFEFLNILSGGGFSNFSIVLLGLAPYITTAIIMQILVATNGSFKKYFFEEGDEGREKFYQYITYITIPISFVQSYGFLRLFQSQGLIAPDIPVNILLLTVLIITAGVIALIWLGSLISKYGIGNGISMIIFAGIIAVLPGQITSIYRTYFESVIDFSVLPILLAFAFILFLVIYFVVYIMEGERRVPIYNTKSARLTESKFSSAANYLPVKIAISGVIPIIFAFSLISFSQVIIVISNFFNFSFSAQLEAWSVSFFSNSLYFGLLTFFLVFLFTYFSVFIYFNPENIAQSFKKTGTFIEGIRPGQETEDYLQKIITRLTFWGALFLGLVAVFPIIIQYFTEIQYLAIGGASILIAVSVLIDLIKKINAQIVFDEYSK